MAGERQQVWVAGHGDAMATYLVAQPSIVARLVHPLPGRQFDRVEGVPRPAPYAAVEGIDRDVPCLYVGARRKARR
jgi:hypothetical protein